jgi:hypothetical protein
MALARDPKPPPQPPAIGRTDELTFERSRLLLPHDRTAPPKGPTERGWVSVYRENVVQFASCNRGRDPTAVFAPGRLRRVTRPKTPTATPESVRGEIQRRLDNLKRYIHKTSPKRQAARRSSPNTPVAQQRNGRAKFCAIAPKFCIPIENDLFSST